MTWYFPFSQSQRHQSCAAQELELVLLFLSRLTHPRSTCALLPARFVCSRGRGAAGPVPDLVPVLDVPGRVPAEGVGGAAAPAGPVLRLHAGVLLGLQGQLAPQSGLPGEPAPHVLSARRDQVTSRPRC